MRFPVRSRRVRASGRATLAGAVLAGAIVLAGCSKTTSGSGTESGLPSLAKSCASGVASAGGQAIPFAETKADGASLAVVAVCLDGHGPYPFELATGAGTSVVTPALAGTLGLKATAPQTAVRGVTCAAAAAPTTVGSLSVGGVRLAGQQLLEAAVPSFGMSPAPEGIIGSDVLSRFLAVRIDYRAKKLTVASPERPAPTGNTILLGQAKAAPPSSLVRGTPAIGAVMEVLLSPDATLLTTSVNFGKHSQTFTVDTGAPHSPITPGASSGLGLSSGDSAASQSGVGCSGTAPMVLSGSWTLNGSSLPQVPLVSQALAGPTNQTLAGAIGADVLGSYGSFVIDYGGAHLWLGAG